MNQICCSPRRQTSGSASVGIAVMSPLTLPKSFEQCLRRIAVPKSPAEMLAPRDSHTSPYASVFSPLPLPPFTRLLPLPRPALSCRLMKASLSTRQVVLCQGFKIFFPRTSVFRYLFLNFISIFFLLLNFFLADIQFCIHVQNLDIFLEYLALTNFIALQFCFFF